MHLQAHVQGSPSLSVPLTQVTYVTRRAHNYFGGNWWEIGEFLSDYGSWHLCGWQGIHSECMGCHPGGRSPVFWETFDMMCTWKDGEEEKKGELFAWSCLRLQKKSDPFWTASWKCVRKNVACMHQEINRKWANHWMIGVMYVGVSELLCGQALIITNVGWFPMFNSQCRITNFEN